MKRKRSNAAIQTAHSTSASFFERMNYLVDIDTRLAREHVPMKNGIMSGDLILIPPPKFVSAEEPFDIYMDVESEYFDKTSIFAPKEMEDVELYRRRIATFPKLNIYLRAFSGKRLGYLPHRVRFQGFDFTRQLSLLFSMWAENGYLQSANHQEIAALGYPLDRWLLNRWIHSWQER